MATTRRVQLKVKQTIIVQSNVNIEILFKTFSIRCNVVLIHSETVV